VWPGVRDTLTTFLPTRLFNTDDFPTLGKPREGRREGHYTYIHIPFVVDISECQRGLVGEQSFKVHKQAHSFIKLLISDNRLLIGR
jgi:hypothetical protein